MNKGRRIAAFISLLLLVCAVLFVGYMLFQVRNISVTGCASLTEEQVEALSGLEYGECIFLVNTDDVMDALKADPLVDPVSVTIEFPYTVAIEIQERTPAAYIDTSGVRLTIDSEAVVLSVDNNPQGEVSPVVTGISTDRFEVGQPLGNDTYKRKVFSDLLNALGAYDLEIAAFDLTYTASIKLQTQNGFCIQLGNADNMATKLSLACYAIGQLAAQGKTGGIIDVSTGAAAYYREN